MFRPSPLPGSRRTGLLLAAGTAVVSGFAVFSNGYGVRAWRDAGASSASYTTIKNLVAAALLAVLALGLTRAGSREGFTRPQRPLQWAGLLAVGVVGGSVPFLLFFEGLARAGSGQAAFIHKTLVLWVALLAVPLLKERLHAGHLLAIGLLLVGQATLLGGIGDLGAGTGEVLILGATLLWSVEVIIAKRLLRDLTASTVGAARMGFGVVILIGYAASTGGFGEMAAMGGTEWLWTLATGAVLTAYVATWYLALSRAPAVDVTAILVFGAVITAFLRNGFDGIALPSTPGLVMISCGAALLLIPALRGRQQTVGA